jgi:hypothetical protein
LDKSRKFKDQENKNISVKYIISTKYYFFRLTFTAFSSSPHNHKPLIHTLGLMEGYTDDRDNPHPVRRESLLWFQIKIKEAVYQKNEKIKEHYQNGGNYWIR